VGQAEIKKIAEEAKKTFERIADDQSTQSRKASQRHEALSNYWRALGAELKRAIDIYNREFGAPVLAFAQGNVPDLGSVHEFDLVLKPVEGIRRNMALKMVYDPQSYISISRDWAKPDTSLMLTTSEETVFCEFGDKVCSPELLAAGILKVMST